MKVVTGGQTFELGTTEAGPTISLIDYSRRETDDFGTTTVVERAFARRLSVKMSVPFDGVDALQARLASLRATSALWVADDRYASLAVQGFYKDFALDLAVPPLSFCSLTVEGLAEAAPAADPGGDPAPDGKASTLRLLQPVTITPAVLTATNVPEADYAEWSNATSYALGARVIRASTHRVYESAVAGNTGNDPAAGAAQWIDVGPTNRWAMFDQALGTATAQAGSIVVTLSGGTINAVALLDVQGATVRVQRTGYDRTLPVAAGAALFLDLPTAASAVTVTITGSGIVSVGTLLIGKLVALGVTEASPTAGITDFSRKEVDEFGEASIVERAWAKRMTTRAIIRTDAMDAVLARVAAVRAKPSLWIGQDQIGSLTLYGFFKDFSIQVGEGVSTLALTVEGLTEASEVHSLAVTDLAGAGTLAGLDAVHFGGGNIKESAGGPDATLSGFKTNQGTAAAIAGQGALATLDGLALGSPQLTGFGGLAGANAVGAENMVVDGSLSRGFPPIIHIPDGGALYWTFEAAGGFHGPSYIIAEGGGGHRVMMAEGFVARAETAVLSVYAHNTVSLADWGAHLDRPQSGQSVFLGLYDVTAGALHAEPGEFFVGSASWQRKVHKVSGLVVGRTYRLVWGVNGYSGRYKTGLDAFQVEHGDVATDFKIRSNELASLADVFSRPITDLMRQDKVTPVTEALVVTPLGIASGFAGQGALATRSDVRAGSHIRASNGDPLDDDSLLNSRIKIVGGKMTLIDPDSRNVFVRNAQDWADVTNLNVASSIAGQGALATKSSITYGLSDIPGLPDAIKPLNMWGGNKLSLAFARYNDGQEAEELKPAEGAANKTETRTAAAIAGQGALATQSAVDLETSQVTNKGRLSKIGTNGRMTDPTMFATVSILGPRSTTNIAPGYTVNASNVTVNLPAHSRVVATASGPATLSYSAMSFSWAFSTGWLAYVDDPNLTGGTFAVGVTNNANDLLYPGRYHVASGTTPSASNTGGSTGSGSGSGGGWTPPGGGGTYPSN